MLNTNDNKKLSSFKKKLQELVKKDPKDFDAKAEDLIYKTAPTLHPFCHGYIEGFVEYCCDRDFSIGEIVIKLIEDEIPYLISKQIQ